MATSSEQSSTRTISWQDPHVTRDLVAERSGLEALRAMRDGILPPPPIAVTMNFGIAEVEVGRVAFTGTPGAEHYNPLGLVHGGWACTILDTVAGCAAHTTLEAGQGYTSIEITVKYLRPITLDSGVLTAVGTVTKPGRRVIFTDAVLSDGAGRALATASSSLLVF